MKQLCLLCVVLILLAATAKTSASGVTIAVDFEEEPVPDLTRISNIYLGGSRYVYAFLIVKQSEGATQGTPVSAFDVGYRLICPDNSVVNHGFRRLANWESLDPEGISFPVPQNTGSVRTPAALGYWKLELKSGARSRAELQLTPNPLNSRPTAAIVDSAGNLIMLEHDTLSQDIRCHGLINQTFYSNEPYDIGGLHYEPGEIIARFMPGVIEMDERMGGVANIVDPGLAEIARTFGLTRITRLYRNAVRNPRPLRSKRRGRYRPIDKWDVYVLSFPQSVDLSALFSAVVQLPRCVYANPHMVPKPTDCGDSDHCPNDSLAADSWHLYRISMPYAWDQEEGSSTVRIGVIDGGVDYHLEDFGGGIGPSYKVVGGYDYDPASDTLPDVKYGDDCEDCNHGNWMTSTVGALSNNDSLGAVGIAGGWGGYEGEIGPAILHFKIREDFSARFVGQWLDEAICDACTTYSCDVVSISLWTASTEDLKEAVRDCYQSGTVLLTALNNLKDADYSYVYYPGCYRNDWVLCTQGSSRHPTSDTDPIPERRISNQDPLYSWSAAWPKDTWPIPVLSVDASAPGSHMCIIWGDSLENERPVYRCIGSGVSYGPPQVAGVAALMLSKNPNLSVRDIEGVISASCTDITTDYQEPGDSLLSWDKYTGWGRINADSCLMFVDESHPCGFYITHDTLYGGGSVVASDTLTKIKFGGYGLLSGEYQACRFEVRRGVTRPSQCLFLWGIPCGNAGWGWSGTIQDYYKPDDYNLQEPYCDLVPTTQYASTCSLFSYVYRVWAGDSLVGWYPSEPESLDWAYGALIQTHSASLPTATGEVVSNTPRITSAAPNPSGGEIMISFVLQTADEVVLSIYDVRGRKVRTVFDGNLSPGVHRKKWDGMNEWGEAAVPGVYFCRLKSKEWHSLKKVVLLDEGGN